MLVRWEGYHDDSWCKYSELNGAMRRAAAVWAHRVLGGWRGAFMRARRLDADEAAAGGARRIRRRLLTQSEVDYCEGARERGSEAVGEGWEDGRARHVRVVADDLEEMDLRGEAWRAEAAGRGRKTRKRHRGAGRTPPPHNRAGVCLLMSLRGANLVTCTIGPVRCLWRWARSLPGRGGSIEYRV